MKDMRVVCLIIIFLTVDSRLNNEIGENPSESNINKKFDLTPKVRLKGRVHQDTRMDTIWVFREA